MRFSVVNLKDFPHQPIKDFAEARNWFIEDLPEDEYVLFTSDHEEVPKMLLSYIERLEPKYPYYRIRLIRLIDGKLEPLFDPTYQPNLCSNRMRFRGFPERPNVPTWKAGIIDIPMLHNKRSSKMHSYKTERMPASWRGRYLHLGFRLFRVYREIIWDELGRGIFHKGDERLY